VSWVSARARAERKPWRVTLIVTTGDLPPGWSRPARSTAARAWAVVFGLVLIAPFVLLATAGALRWAGVGLAYDWIASSPPAILAATVSLFIGIPIAFVINAWPITRLGLRRGAGELEGLVALEVAPLHLAVVLLALVAGGAFVAHLGADSYACLNGVHSAC
jgi:hypothetical protein